MIGLRNYDAALLDVHMPGMDGLELAQAIRKIESERGLPRMPIIALTADVQAETAHAPASALDRRRAAQAGQ